MNEKLKEFLETKRNIELDKEKEEKRKNLIELGLYDKVYSPDNSYSEEFCLSEWNSDESKNKYYKIETVEITDEEYQEVKKYLKKEENKEKNSIATLLVFFAWVLFIGGLIAGVKFGEIEVVKTGYYATYTEKEFSFSVAVAYWGVALVSGLMFIGLAEIIKLLHDIKNK